MRLSSESVRNEAQGVAEGGCTAQGSTVPNRNCKKQSDVYGVNFRGTEALPCLAPNKCTAQR